MPVEASPQIFVNPDIQIPSWSESVEGMHIISNDPEDQYRIQLTRGITYCHHGRDLKLDLFTHWTPLPNYRYPLVLFIRGSGWLKQELDGFIPQLTEIARAGYVVASIEYRHTEEYCGFPAQIEDAKAAIHFLQLHSEEYHIDPERVAIMGDSAGAHTAIMTGFTDGTDLFCCPEEVGIALNIKCVVDVFAPTNFQTIFSQPAGVDYSAEDSYINRFLKYSAVDHPEILASPVNFVNNERCLPPTLIIHGDKDRMVPFPQSVELYKTMRDHGQNVEFYMVRGGEHGTYIWIRQVFQLILEFLNNYLL